MYMRQHVMEARFGFATYDERDSGRDDHAYACDHR